MSRNSAEAEQQAAEIEAREHGEVLALARRASEAGTWDLDLRENVVRYCPRSLEMLGHPPDRSPILTPEEWARHIFPGDAERVIAEGLRARQSGTNLITEYRIIKADGGIRWIRGMGRTLRDENGEPVRSVGFNFDVTEEKQAEAEVRQMQGELVQASRASARAIMTDTLVRALERPLTAVETCIAEAQAGLNGSSHDRAEQARIALDRAAEAVREAAEIVTNLRAAARGASSERR